MSAAQTLPAHVAIIMDGNGRWAQQHLRPRAFGHKAGRVAVDRVVTACAKAGVQTLSLYAFSTENWRRPAHEVKVLMELIETALREEAEKMQKNDIRLRVLGLALQCHRRRRSADRRRHAHERRPCHQLQRPMGIVRNRTPPGASGCRRRNLGRCH